MSSPAQGGPERRGLGRVISRMRTVLRRPRRQGTTVEPPTIPEEPAETSATAPATSAREPAKHVPGATQVPRAQLFEERAKKLAERYGLEIQPTAWQSLEGHALRVEKPIKMRVHRHCHVCKAKETTTSFGLAKDCPVCGHTRCKQCPRVPPKRTEAEKEASRKKRAAILKERAENAPIIPDWDLSEKKKVVLRRPAKSGGQDLVYKKPRQRVRRICCSEGCGTLFTSGSKQCEACGHIRCTDCVRDPAKKDKYPYGYPGDEPGRKLGHFQCHNCQSIFRSHPDAETECPDCQHKKCADCTRMAPKKVEPEPDPEIWKSVQEKLQALSIK